MRERVKEKQSDAHVVSGFRISASSYEVLHQLWLALDARNVQRAAPILQRDVVC